MQDWQRANMRFLENNSGKRGNIMHWKKGNKMQISQRKKHCDWLKNNLRTNQVPQSAGRHLEVWHLIKNPQPKLNLHRFCHTSKGYLNHFFVAYNSTAYDLFSGPTQNWDHTYVLVRPKDAVDLREQDGVVYKIPCKCGKVYIGETGRCMHERIKEHAR